MRYRQRPVKGSITVEACIILPLFICFVALMLFSAKLIYVDILLEHGVNESAKQIAAHSYPVAVINEYEDELMQNVKITNTIKAYLSGERRIADISQDSEGQSLLESIFGKEEPNDAGALFKEAVSISAKGLIGALAGSLSDEYWELENKLEYNIAAKLLKENINSKVLALEDLKLKYAILPQSESEYSFLKSTDVYDGLGLVPDVDFAKNDVIIQTEYDYKLILPILGTKTIKLVHTSVEHAWLSGGNGTITSSEEGLDFLEEEQDIIVYITRTGKRYHVGDCRYLHSSKIAIKKKDAEVTGYTPCKVCNPDS